VVLDLSDEPKFETFFLADPPRLVTDVYHIPESQEPQQIATHNNVLHRIRLASHSPGTIRLVLDLKNDRLQHDVFVLEPMYGRPFRLVIDVKSPELEERAKEERRAIQQAKAHKTCVVVIDPGHGGEDPGAIGPAKTREKDVVLSVSRTLQERLNSLPDMRAFLTRTGDYYVGLKERTKIAQEYGADLFVSIHTDASRTRGSQGASVYCLSFKGATDEAARILAERENAADFVGGVRLDEEETLNAILLDLMQTQTINDSLDFAGIVLEEISDVQNLKFNRPRQAGFWVLKAPDIPSVLIELGYISNPREERMLRTSAFRLQATLVMENAIRHFLCQQKSMNSDQLTPEFCSMSGPRIHIVERGQSLSRIASLYHTNIQRIQSLNRIKNPSRIYPGQKLIIP
jgi:N-acetylmuramoyl-L-alanine amidase